MKRILSIRTMVSFLGVAALVAIAGCTNADGTPNVTGLDLLNTVLLGITAAGGIAILRNV